VSYKSHSLIFYYFLEIENALLVLCVATYGEGDPTDNAQSLFDFISNNDSDFSGLSYAVCSEQLNCFNLFALGFWFGQQNLRAFQ
jgi:sulfite reductase alpha subunit-like flavoprotein